MRNVLATLSIAFLVWGCTTEVKKVPGPAAPAAEEQQAVEEETPKEDVEAFGDPIDPNVPKVELSELLVNGEKYKGKKVTSDGTVRQVCQKRGCWAEIRPSESIDSATMRVTFFGYAYFLPKDSRGAKVTIQGDVEVRLIPADEVKHLEAEGATFPKKNADGSAIATQFIATGVEMRGRSK